MGLDLIEFVYGVEEAFGRRIPNDVAGTLTTPRRVIDYMHGQLPQATGTPCLTQRAFYAVRRELRRRLDEPPPSLCPSTPLAGLLAGREGATRWAEVGEALRVRPWPRAGSGGWLSGLFGPRARTLGEAAGYTAIRLGVRLKPPGEGWSWHEVAWIVDQLIRQQFAIDKYSLDDEFVRDLGVD